MAIASHLITCTVGSIIMISAGLIKNARWEDYIGMVFMTAFYTLVYPLQWVYCFVSPHLFRWISRTFKSSLFLPYLTNIMIGTLSGVFVTMSFIRWQGITPLVYPWIVSGMTAGAIQSFLFTLFWRYQEKASLQKDSLPFNRG